MSNTNEPIQAEPTRASFIEIAYMLMASSDEWREIIGIDQRPCAVPGITSWHFGRCEIQCLADAFFGRRNAASIKNLEEAIELIAAGRAPAHVIDEAKNYIRQHSTLGTLNAHPSRKGDSNV